tara:strand:+ start:12385 stop:12882 length:498 start_codon:yes stop_codon:yes gene_type:complete
MPKKKKSMKIAPAPIDMGATSSTFAPTPSPAFTTTPSPLQRTDEIRGTGGLQRTDEIRGSVRMRGVRGSGVDNFGETRLPDDDDFRLGSNATDVRPRMGSLGRFIQMPTRPQQMPLQRRPFTAQRLLFPENQHHQQPLHQSQFRTPEQFLQLAGRIDDEEEKEEE